MSLPKAVKIVEVGPRDGLQNELVSLDVATKVKLVHDLADAGLKTIEAGSFVSPKWVPQMAGSDEVFKQLAPSRATYTALTPNMHGLERAIECKVKEIAVFAAASEAFSQKNINCSISESLEKFEAVTHKAKQHNIRVRGYILRFRMPLSRGCRLYKSYLCSTVITGYGLLRNLIGRYHWGS